MTASPDSEGVSAWQLRPGGGGAGIVSATSKRWVRRPIKPDGTDFRNRESLFSSLETAQTAPEKVAAKLQIIAVERMMKKSRSRIVFYTHLLQWFVMTFLMSTVFRNHAIMIDHDEKNNKFKSGAEASNTV